MTRPRPEDEYVFDDPEPRPAGRPPVAPPSRRHRTGLIISLVAGGLLVVALIIGLGVYVMKDNLHRVADLSEGPGQAPVPVGNATVDGNVSRDESETFTYDNVEYSLELSIQYVPGQAFVPTATLKPTSNVAEPDGAPLLIQEIDFIDTSDSSNIVNYLCFSGSDYWVTATMRNETSLTCNPGHPTFDGVKTPLGTAKSGIVAQVLICDTSKAGYQAEKTYTSTVAHVFSYTFA